MPGHASGQPDQPDQPGAIEAETPARSLPAELQTGVAASRHHGSVVVAAANGGELRGSPVRL